MNELRVRILDNAHGEDARLAATILSDCFTRQGIRNQMVEGGLVISGCARRTADPEEIYVVLDEALLSHEDLLGKLDQRTSVVICSARPARTLQHELGRFTAGVTTVDASGIAMHEGADPVIAMLGGAARSLPLIDPETLSSSVWNVYDHNLPYAAHAALRAFDQGYSQAQLAQ